jgi:hypothetical protein
VAELRREARQLRLQPDSMIPDDPRRRQLEEQPGAITGRMRELQGASNQVSGSLKTVSAAMLAVVALKVAEKLKERAGAAIEFTKKGIEMARSTQGIRLAFNRFAGSDDLKKLRVETKVLCLPPNFFH